MDDRQKLGLGVAGGVGILVLLWLLRRRESGGASPVTVEQFSFELPGIVMNVPPGMTYNLKITGPAFQAASGCDCGCDNSEAEKAYNDLIHNFANSLNSLQADYTAKVLDSIPDYLWQFYGNGAAQVASATGQARIATL